jgi:hypothetical protein
MDALSRLGPVGLSLLRQVDVALATHGAPATHPVWPLLRQVGATASDAVRAVAGLRPDDIRAAGVTVRSEVEALAAMSVPVDVDWHGAAGDAYALVGRALDQHLRGPGGGSLAGRLGATADYADEVADWCARSRLAMARALAEVLGSAEAVTVRTGADMSGVAGRAVVLAAADIAAHVLTAAAGAVAEGQATLARWPSRLGELTYRAPAGAGAGHPETTLRVRP